MKNFSRVLKNLCILAFLACSFLSNPLSVYGLQEEALFAGGCFWCLEHDLENLSGVESVESGYSGGNFKNPNYRQVSEKKTDHQESVRVLFDPQEISYENLLRSYWRNIDPFDEEGQFCDKGDSYLPVIFTNNENQVLKARESLNKAAVELGVLKEDLKVEVKNATNFWIAEDYHQDFAVKNPVKYKFYRFNCGRDFRLEKVWGSRARSDSEWKLD